MSRPPYEYSSPLGTLYSNRPLPVYGDGHRQCGNSFVTEPAYCVGNYEGSLSTFQPGNVTDAYEGSNDTTLRVEERNWYLENHRTIENNVGQKRDTLPKVSSEHKNNEDKKSDSETVIIRREGGGGSRRKKERCSCECWPSANSNVVTDNSSAVNIQQNDKVSSQSTLDMVASYGVYRNPYTDEDEKPAFVRPTNLNYAYHQPQGQSVVVNQSGASSVARPQRSGCLECLRTCCKVKGASATATGETDCWSTYCRPALISFLLIFMLVVFGLVAGLLLYNNYIIYKPKPQIAEAEPCEKTFCRWGAECVPLGGGRAHCACPSACTRASPVCDTAGRTHASHCHLRKAACERRLNVRVKHVGECGSEPMEAGSSCPRACRASRPVCGTDARDYASACHLHKFACEQQLNITVKFQGKCDPCATHTCAGGGVCQLSSARDAVCRCGEPCPLEHAPVCASDGETYASECELRRAACRRRQQIRIVYRGDCSSGVHPCSAVRCRAGERCSLDARGAARCGCGPVCEPVLRPLCATDRNTYDNACELRRAACLANADIQLLYEGKCGDTNPCATHTCAWGATCAVRGGRAACTCPRCEPRAAPVCASDGNTYGDECKMRAHACAAQLEMRTLYNGTCDSCEDKECLHYAECRLDPISVRASCVCKDNCPEAVTDDSVCGSDGATYASECHLQAAACLQQRDIELLFRGDCSLCQDVKCAWGGRCEAGECVCPTDCTDAAAEPVCANTMQTFASECELQRAACELARGALRVVFYGDCKERFAVAGPPLPITSTLAPLTFAEHNHIISNTTSLQITVTDEPTHGSLEHSACADIHCDFDATCELGPDRYPRCTCVFDCEPGDEGIFPVCASDFKIYGSMCEMRREGCHKQVELRLRPLELCRGMEVRACAGGGSPVVDPATGAAMDCGSGPHRRDCPLGSYCHHGLDAARCCTKNETKILDDKSPCSGPLCTDAEDACACNRLGAVSERCEAATQACACRPGVGGHKCDRCEPGYWGLAHFQPTQDQRAGCTPCGCSVYGSVREDCEQMTGRCVCKAGVQGHKCTVCINDTQILGPNGCETPDRTMDIPMTCGNLVCYYGAICVERDDRASCECPAASCPSDPGDDTQAVCGSDGKSYPSECHLKLQACRTQEDIVLQAFGSCQLEDPSGTALPAKPYSPLHFTQQDDVNSPSKSTRHLLLPDPRYYYKSELMKKGTPSDIDKLSGGNKAPQRPTAATSGAVGALLGDLCSSHGDCAALPGALCRGAACQCREGHEPAQDRKGCLPITMKTSVAPTEEYSACISDPCVNLGTCIDLPDATYMCVCDTLYTGLNCEVLLVDSDIGNFIEVPSFDGNSFIRLKPLKAYHKLNFDVEFKTLSDNGLIIYNQQRTDGTGDFVSLAIVNGYVVFRYDLGDGIVTLKSPERVSLREYHKISAKRYHRDGILSVDTMEDIVGQSAGSLKALDLLDDTYVGSVQTNYSRVYENIGTNQGLTGCVKYLRLIRHQVTKKLGRLDSPVLSMERVRECGSNPCVSMPCQNGATCQPQDLSTTEYTCTCAGGFSGQYCEDRFDPCESNPCGEEDGVLCDVTPDGNYVCKCLFGTQVGQRKGICNNEINNIQSVNIPKFNGSSYIELPRLEGLARAFRIEMWILTNRLSGMLFYTGQSTRAKGDFVAINLVNGYLQFRFNLGSGIANITYPHKITKDRWHRVRASRVERHGSLQLDELPVHKGHSIPPLTELNLELPVFIGSLPSYIKPHKLSGLTSSFIGAIQQVFVNGNPLTLYSDDIATCRIVLEEDVIPCATTGVVPYGGPPCSAETSPCQNGATCVPMLNEYRCLCSEEFTGRNCDSRLVDVVGVNAPLKFVGNNYYAYRNRGRRRKNVDRGIRYEIKFRTHNESGLLMWRRKSGARADDFLAIGLSHAHLHFVYSDRDDPGLKQSVYGRLGYGQSSPGQSGPGEHWFKSLRFPRRIDDGLWHTVVVKRRKRMAMIQLDNHSPIRGFSQSSLIVTKANPKVWIGGAPSLPLGLPAPLYVGLRGCVASIKTNGRHIDLNVPIGRSGDLQRCI